MPLGNGTHLQDGYHSAFLVFCSELQGLSKPREKALTESQTTSKDSNGEGGPVRRLLTHRWPWACGPQ